MVNHDTRFVVQHFFHMPTLPALVTALPLVADEEHLDELIRIRQLVSDARQWRRLTDQRISALVHLAAKPRLSAKTDALETLRSRPTSSSAKTSREVFVAPEASPADFEDGPVDLWFEASVAMNNLSTGYGIDYLHVLQPNQYYSKKVFTDEERKSLSTRRLTMPTRCAGTIRS